LDISATVTDGVRPCCRQRCRQRVLIRSMVWLSQGTKCAGRSQVLVLADAVSVDDWSAQAGAYGVGGQPSACSG
jgi:hypothetical protein